MCDDGPEPATDEGLDRAFAALADPIRRAMIARLSRGPVTATELGAPLSITKQAVSKHIAVLEQAGLVTRSHEAQRRPVSLRPAALEQLTSWLDRYRLLAEQRFRRLDDVLAAGHASAAIPSHTLQPAVTTPTTAPQEET